MSGAEVAGQSGGDAAETVRSGGSSRTWKRAGALFAVTLTLAIFSPFVLVTVPFAFLVFTAPGRRFLPLLAAGAGAAAVLGGTVRPGIWFVERGWTLLLGGGFAALSLRWPNRSFFPRALGAVALAFAGAGAVFAVQGGRWIVLEWMIGDHLRSGMANAMEAMRLLQGGTPLPAAVVSTLYRTAEIQGDIFPAMLGLSSLAALGVAWWLYVRLVDGGDGALAPLSDFKFDDQLVWVLVAGAALVVVREGTPLGRAGLNALCFMGALYMVRGAAVVAGIARGRTAFWFMLAIGFVFLPPIVVVGAFVIGLADTWLDIRARARRT